MKIQTIYIDKCPTCGNAAYSPFRRFLANGSVDCGCIDGFHTGHLQQISESNRWHNRPEAKKLRRDVEKRYGYRFSPLSDAA
jgi:hypothetical protein